MRITTNPNPTAHRRWYVPYTTIEDLRSPVAGLGIVNESDAWLTGRPYGLPGTAAITITRDPRSGHYDASLRGAETDSTLVFQLQALVEQQKAQEYQLRRIAFWQALGTSVLLGAVALNVLSALRGR
jgi:hypothetical protein